MFIFGLIAMLLPFVLSYYGVSHVAMFITSGIWLFIGFVLSMVLVGESVEETGYAKHYDIDTKENIIPFASALSMLLNMVIMTHFTFPYGVLLIISLSFVGLIASINYARNKVFAWNIKEYEEFGMPSKNLLKTNVLYTSYYYIFSPVLSAICMTFTRIIEKLEGFDFNIFKSAKGDYE